MSEGFRFFSLTSAIAARLFPDEAFDTNKSRRGRALIIAGSKDHLGAGILSARASARTGAGYTFLSSDVSLKEKIQNPDFIYLTDPNFEIDKAQAVLVGPGLGTGSKTLRLIEKLKKINHEAVVLDADALTVCAKENLFPLPSSWILTPHEGELARLMKCTSEQVRHHRMHWARRAQSKFKARIVLKGPSTLIVSNHRCYQNTSGNTALAKAGTGDVLAGIITAFRAQGLSALRAACLGVYLHGLCAEIWVSDGNDPLGLLASDLLEILPRALMRIHSEKASRAES